MKKEYFKDITIAYMRRTGAYGPENSRLMENLKSYLRDRGLMDDKTVILGIALDDPANTSPEEQRYDVGIIIEEDTDAGGLDKRKIDDGEYAVFEIPHRAEDIEAFWNNIENIGALDRDGSKPIIERYAAEKIKKHICEICIPLK